MYEKNTHVLQTNRKQRSLDMKIQLLEKEIQNLWDINKGPQDEFKAT